MFLFLFKSKFKVKRRWWSLENLLSVIFVINVFCISPSEGAEVANCDKGCFNGDCIHTRGKGGEEDSYKCECWEGWRGEKCELCGGKVKLRENGSQTWLAEAVGNYTINMKVKYFYQTFLLNIFVLMKCTWVVEAEQPDSRIRLHIRDFETECGWDHLYIWDGDNIFNGLQVN